MLDRDVYILWHFLYDYNLNCKSITLCCWLKIIVCCYRQDVIVQVGLVCVEGCAVGSIPTIYAAVYDELLREVSCIVHAIIYWL